MLTESVVGRKALSWAMTACPRCHRLNWALFYVSRSRPSLFFESTQSLSMGHTRWTAWAVDRISFFIEQKPATVVSMELLSQLTFSTLTWLNQVNILDHLKNQNFDRTTWFIRPWVNRGSLPSLTERWRTCWVQKTWLASNQPLGPFIHQVSCETSCKTTTPLKGFIEQILNKAPLKRLHNYVALCICCQTFCLNFRQTGYWHRLTDFKNLTPLVYYLKLLT